MIIKIIKKSPILGGFRFYIIPRYTRNFLQFRSYTPF